MNDCLAFFLNFKATLLDRFLIFFEFSFFILHTLLKILDFSLKPSLLIHVCEAHVASAASFFWVIITISFLSFLGFFLLLLFFKRRVFRLLLLQLFLKLIDRLLHFFNSLFLSLNTLLDTLRLFFGVLYKFSVLWGIVVDVRGIDVSTLFNQKLSDLQKVVFDSLLNDCLILLWISRAVIFVITVTKLHAPVPLGCLDIYATFNDGLEEFFIMLLLLIGRVFFVAKLTYQLKDWVCLSSVSTEVLLLSIPFGNINLESRGN